MSNELVVQKTLGEWSPEKIELLKTTICKGATDDQLELFRYVCNHTKLDPFLKQIYGIIRNGKDGPVMTIQTSIDGLRLIADRTGKYLPGREPTFVYDQNKRVFSATAYIKKQTTDGQWHEVCATAHLSEYMPKYANDFWATKPHLMTSKCAEALALRKAFPAEMAGVYSEDEMDQAKLQEAEAAWKQPTKDISNTVLTQSEPIKPKEEPKLSGEKISKEQAEVLDHLIADDEDYRRKFMKSMFNRYMATKIEDMPIEAYATALELTKDHVEKTRPIEA